MSESISPRTSAAEAASRSLAEHVSQMRSYLATNGRAAAAARIAGLDVLRFKDEYVKIVMTEPDRLAQNEMLTRYWYFDHILRYEIWDFKHGPNCEHLHRNYEAVLTPTVFKARPRPRFSRGLRA